MDRIILLSSDDNLNARIRDSQPALNLSLFESSRHVIDEIYNSPPSLLIVGPEPELRKVVLSLREDPIFSHLPIFVILAEGEMVASWHTLKVDDYIRLPFDPVDFGMRLTLALYRAKRVVETNPLTMLPGNTPITKEVQRRLDEKAEFGIAYADLDHFKPYNDKYGFSRGDEIIRMSARLITNVVRAQDPQTGFVGHIGGDDFVYLTATDRVERISKEIVQNFDRIIPTFYDPEDRDRGSIVSVDRTGTERTFPLLSISIGITYNRGWFTHYGAISQAASEMKKYAKSFDGSSWRVDMRDYGRNGVSGNNHTADAPADNG